MPSTACWSWDARSPSASPDFQQGWGSCAHTSAPCNTAAFAAAGAHAVAVTIAFIIITVFHIVLGELAPKSLALQRPERVALWIVRPLSLFLAVFRPAIFVLNGLGNAVVCLFGLEPGHAEGRLHSTEELKLLVAASKDGGLVQSAQQEVVERAFGMGERRVRAIMTPRHDVYWVNADGTPDSMLRAMRQSRHEQVVVARGTLDKVVGVLRKQDLLDLHLDGKLPAPAPTTPEGRRPKPCCRPCARRWSCTTAQPSCRSWKRSRTGLCRWH